jgi:hypothetical protein
LQRLAALEDGRSVHEEKGKYENLMVKRKGKNDEELMVNRKGKSRAAFRFRLWSRT